MAWKLLTVALLVMGLSHTIARERLFEPAVGADERETRFAAWQRHVAAAREP